PHNHSTASSCSQSGGWANDVPSGFFAHAFVRHVEADCTVSHANLLEHFPLRSCARSLETLAASSVCRWYELPGYTSRLALPPFAPPPFVRIAPNEKCAPTDLLDFGFRQNERRASGLRVEEDHHKLSRKIVAL